MKQNNEDEMIVTKVNDLSGSNNNQLVATYWQNSESKSKKLVCVFPGYNYPVEAPVLFYLKLLFLNNGFDWFAIDYRYNENLDFQRLKDDEKEKCFSEDQLKIGTYISDNFKEKEIILLGKSLGTSAISSMLEQPFITEYITNIILLTPTDLCFKVVDIIENKMLPTELIIGDYDPYFTKVSNSRLFTSEYTNSTIIENAGHLFEDKKKDINISIQNLSIVTDTIYKNVIMKHNEQLK